MSIELQKMKSGWSIVYTRWILVILPKNVIIYLKIDNASANSAYPDEMSHDAAFHLGLHCLPKDPLRGVLSTKSYYHSA